MIALFHSVTSYGSGHLICFLGVIAACHSFSSAAATGIRWAEPRRGNIIEPRTSVLGGAVFMNASARGAAQNFLRALRCI